MVVVEAPSVDVTIDVPGERTVISRPDVHDVHVVTTLAGLLLHNGHCLQLKQQRVACKVETIGLSALLGVQSQGDEEENGRGMGVT